MALGVKKGKKVRLFPSKRMQLGSLEFLEDYRQAVCQIGEKDNKKKKKKEKKKG